MTTQLKPRKNMQLCTPEKEAASVTKTDKNSGETVACIEIATGLETLATVVSESLPGISTVDLCTVLQKDVSTLMRFFWPIGTQITQEYLSNIKPRYVSTLATLQVRTTVTAGEVKHCPQLITGAIQIYQDKDMGMYFCTVKDYQELIK